MNDLIAFLRARLDEDEQVAHGGDGQSPDMTLRLDDDLRWVSVTPARVLRDVEAKRKLLDWHWGGHECTGPEDSCMWIPEEDVCPTVRALAEPYADHDDYRPEWRP